MSGYKWVFDPRNPRERLFAVGILDDGTLYNPNGYPPDIVRAGVQAADACRHEQASQAAKKAAVTRRKRQEKRVWEAAWKIVMGLKTGPRHNCYCCGKGLDDPQSIERGIGSECWQHVLSKLQAFRTHQQSGETQGQLGF
jgi:hypothetical protein